MEGCEEEKALGRRARHCRRRQSSVSLSIPSVTLQFSAPAHSIPSHTAHAHTHIHTCSTLPRLHMEGRGRRERERDEEEGGGERERERESTASTALMQRSPAAAG